MLQVNPKILPRLAKIEKNLLLRRKRAQEEFWLGEVEGIDSPLAFLCAKQDKAARPVKRPVTGLGILRPVPRKCSDPQRTPALRRAQTSRRPHQPVVLSGGRLADYVTVALLRT
ncbi:hypothetical protein ACFY3N_20165 [Streptomyces sp. NPDC000348]|uniref:hypothetical protein n=1 Tax=Streptomyces sp. NPDC000348 TaxID=3364538 RepID=UPI0036B3E127